MTDVDELITLVRLQLDERAEAAQAAAALTRSPWTARGGAVVVNGDGFTVVRDDSDRPERAVVDHIVFNDPASVLADIEAKRRILDLIELAHVYEKPGDRRLDEQGVFFSDPIARRRLRDVLHQLASHPERPAASETGLS